VLQAAGTAAAAGNVKQEWVGLDGIGQLLIGFCNPVGGFSPGVWGGGRQEVGCLMVGSGGGKQLALFAFGVKGA
jgi:hypothetical protein